MGAMTKPLIFLRANPAMPTKAALALTLAGIDWDPAPRGFLFGRSAQPGVRANLNPMR